VLLFVPALAVFALRFVWVPLALPPGPYVDIPHGVPDVLWLLVKPALYLTAAALSLPLSHWGPLDWVRAHAWVLGIPAASASLVAWVLVRAAGRARAWLLLGCFTCALLPPMPVRPTSLYLYVPLTALALLMGLAYQTTRRRVFMAWLGTWIAIGIGTHLYAESFLARISRDADAQAATIEQLVRTRGAARLVAIDAPVWQYALPAAVKLRAPDLDYDTWFVNFAPRLDAPIASHVTWRNATTLELDAGNGRFLASQFEHFLAFGGSPRETRLAAGAPLAVTPLDASVTPRRLTIRFKDRETLRASAIVQFGPRALAEIRAPNEARGGR